MAAAKRDPGELVLKEQRPPRLDSRRQAKCARRRRGALGGPVAQADAQARERKSAAPSAQSSSAGLVGTMVKDRPSARASQAHGARRPARRTGRGSRRPAGASPEPQEAVHVLAAAQRREDREGIWAPSRGPDESVGRRGTGSVRNLAKSSSSPRWDPASGGLRAELVQGAAQRSREGRHNAARSAVEQRPQGQPLTVGSGKKQGQPQERRPRPPLSGALDELARGGARFRRHMLTLEQVGDRAPRAEADGEPRNAFPRGASRSGDFYERGDDCRGFIDGGPRPPRSGSPGSCASWRASRPDSLVGSGGAQAPRTGTRRSSPSSRMTRTASKVETIRPRSRGDARPGLVGRSPDESGAARAACPAPAIFSRRARSRPRRFPPSGSAAAPGLSSGGSTGYDLVQAVVVERGAR